MRIFALIAALLLQAPAVVPGDVYIQAELKKEITTRRSHPGQPVVLTVTRDASGADGKVVIPAGAKLSGKLVVVHKREKDAPATFGFVVDRAEWKGGSVPLNAVISSLQGIASTETGGSAPNLSRSGMQATGSNTYVTAVPADCTVTTAAEGPAVTCTKHELELGPGTPFILRNSAASTSSGS